MNKQTRVEKIDFILLHHRGVNLPAGRQVQNAEFRIQN